MIRRLALLLIALAPSLASAEDDEDRWLHFELGGVHPFAGLAWKTGPAVIVADSANTGVPFSAMTRPFEVTGSLLFAVRGGIFIERHEFAIELSPLTFVPYSGSPPVFSAVATYAYYLSVYQSSSLEVYWPLRAGGGGAVGSHPYFQALLEVLGPSVRAGHVMIDFQLPGFRWLRDPEQNTQLTIPVPQLLTWHLGASASYVF